MDYNYLITKQDIAAFKLISANVDFDLKIKPLIKEAQDFDLKASIGYALFFDLLKNYTKENFSVPYTGASGAFTVGEIITADSGAIGGVVSASGTILVLTGAVLSWESAATITGGTSTSPANLTATEIAYGKSYRLRQGADSIN